MLVIRETHGPLDENILTHFEQSIGSTVPKMYRKFLLMYNGGKPHPDAFDIPDPVRPNCSDLRVFFGLHEGHYNLAYEVNIYRGRIPSELMPIACDSFGNLICIGVKGEYFEKIFFWNHEYESPLGKTATWDNIILLASDFTEFLNSLHEINLDDFKA